MDKMIRKMQARLMYSHTEKTAWKIVDNYFRFFDLKSFEEEFYDMLVGALSSNEIQKSEKGRDRYNFIFFYEYTKLLVAAIKLLHERKIKPNN
jgi:hypothetical protein